jgi:WD40 repeat protein
LVQSDSEDIAELRKIISMPQSSEQQSPATASKRSFDSVLELQANALFSSNSLARLHTLTLHEDSVESLAKSDQYLLSASWDCTIRVCGAAHCIALHWSYVGMLTHQIQGWDIETFECKVCYRCDSDVRELLVHGNRLYSGCGNGAIQVWDLEKNECIMSQLAHIEDVLALRMCNGRLFSSGSDTTIKVYTHAHYLQSYRVDVCLCAL